MYNAAGQINKDQLVERFAPLVKRIAYHLMARLPSSVQVDDLVQNGMIGLLDAIDRFESGMGAQFETYAAQRVRGAMLDGLRENDWLPRSLRRDFRRIETAIAQLEQQKGRAPSESELAAAMGLPLADYQKLLQDARGHQLISFEDMLDDEDGDFLERHLADASNEPSKLLEDENLRQRLTQGIEALPEREKLMMALYYEQDLNLREIGEVMGVTESRVCQLHSQAVARLRARIFDRVAPRKAKVNG
jgi:RNA polymerase sigma factor FliA